MGAAQVPRRSPRRVMLKIAMKIAVRQMTHRLQNTLMKMVRYSNIVHDTLFRHINLPRVQERLDYYIDKDDVRGDSIGSRDRQSR